MEEKEEILNNFCEEKIGFSALFGIEENIKLIRLGLDGIEKKIESGGFINPLGEFQYHASTMRLDNQLIRYEQAKRLCDDLVYSP